MKQINEQMLENLRTITDPEKQAQQLQKVQRMLANLSKASDEAGITQSKIWQIKSQVNGA